VSAAVPESRPVRLREWVAVVAFTIGMVTIGWASLVQTLEGYVLLPRIMSHAVGVSALVGLLAVLALGSVYGVVGILLAFPLAAVAQVLLEPRCAHWSSMARQLYEHRSRITRRFRREAHAPVSLWGTGVSIRTLSASTAPLSIEDRGLDAAPANVHGERPYLVAGLGSVSRDCSHRD
jgi:hypothetical protein